MKKNQNVSLTRKLLAHLNSQKKGPYESYDSVIRRLIMMDLEPGQAKRLTSNQNKIWIQAHNNRVMEAGAQEYDDEDSPI